MTPIILLKYECSLLTANTLLFRVATSHKTGMWALN